MSTTIETAIKRSVSHTEIVSLEWTADLEAALLAECEDSVTTEDRVEAWGKTEDGDEWRVHLTGPREASCETRVFQGHESRQVTPDGRPLDADRWYYEPADYEGDVMWCATSYASREEAARAAAADGVRG